MRLVADEATLRQISAEGGSVFLQARGSRCCAGRTYTLEAASSRPEGAFELVHEERGICVWAMPWLAEPAEVHLETGRRGRLRAFWNGQSWIG